jgi:uncharacterized delta-60 repeat protein
MHGPSGGLARRRTFTLTFGQAGLVTTSDGEVPGVDGVVTAVQVQSDGKILATGGHAIWRYLSNGALDSSYGTGGVVTLPNNPAGYPRTVLLAGDVLLIAVGADGTGDVTLSKYASDGSLDLAFGVDGVATTTLLESNSVASIAVQPDGKILVSGGGYLRVLRLNADGSTDIAFGTNGVAINPVDSLTQTMALQPDGAIVVGGTDVHDGTSDFVLTRFEATGAVDPSFGSGGVVETDPLGGGIDTLNHLLMTPDGGVIAVGQTLDVNDVYWIVLVGYDDGAINPLFGVLGVAKVNFDSHDVASSSYTFPFAGRIDAQGKILEVGEAEIYPFPFVMARFDGSGTLDATFGSGGKVVTRFPRGGAQSLALAVTPDERIVVAGNAWDEPSESNPCG